jgi:hypothetical protein
VHERSGAPALGFEDAEDRAMDRLGLRARIRHCGGGLAEEEELARLGTFHPAQHDRAPVGLDPKRAALRRRRAAR